MRALSICLRLKLSRPFSVFDFMLDKTKKRGSEELRVLFGVEGLFCSFSEVACADYDPNS